jgi:DNA adenine methylase
MAGLTPPLKWAGGKRWLVPYIEPIWKAHSERRLVELFSGGASVTLSFLPRQALLNDINPHLVNFYRWLQWGLHVSLSSADHDEKTYYQRRERFNTLIREHQADTQEAAELFYYLNRTGYNGLCRFSKSGLFNVPFGKYKTINYFTTQDFSHYMTALREWSFTEGDFQKVPIQENDFVYADPPYDVQFTQYSKEGFDWSDQIRLAEWLSNQPVPIVVSNQATSRILELYRDLKFEVQIVSAPRMINSTGDRTRADEMLAFKNVVIPEMTQQLQLF